MKLTVEILITEVLIITRNPNFILKAELFFSELLTSALYLTQRKLYLRIKCVYSILKRMY